jgi:hypothetical protein
LFAGLVDFVEVELAWNWINFGDKESSKYAPKFYNRTHWRSREAGLAQLEWQCSLVFDDTWVSPSNPDYGKPTPQALSAMQIRELYLWWTETYRNRRDPYEVSGYDAFWESIRKDTEDSDMDALDRVLYRKMSPEIEEESRRLYDEINKIEQDYNKEEEEMMVALIRLRESLWT